MFVKLTILMCPNAINVNVALVFLLLILVTTSSLYLYRFSTVENLITFDNNNALKIKVINVTLTANIANGDSISVEGIPSTAVFVSGFLYNYIKGEKMNIYEYWDLQVSQPNRCVIRKIKNYGFTSYATILAFYK